METNPKYETILALDVGERRIGVARTHIEHGFPGPLTTLENPDTFIDDIVVLCRTEKAAAVVVGLPRGLEGQETAQTAAIRSFGEHLEAVLAVPVYWNDEAVTSAKAEAELQARGKRYSKGDIDALAATYILEDFMNAYKRQHPEQNNG
jgi:putative Holliday junction resolvase